MESLSSSASTIASPRFAIVAEEVVAKATGGATAKAALSESTGLSAVTTSPEDSIVNGSSVSFQPPDRQANVGITHPDPINANYRNNRRSYDNRSQAHRPSPVAPSSFPLPYQNGMTAMIRPRPAGEIRGSYPHPSGGHNFHRGNNYAPRRQPDNYGGRRPEHSDCRIGFHATPQHIPPPEAVIYTYMGPPLAPVGAPYVIPENNAFNMAPLQSAAAFPSDDGNSLTYEIVNQIEYYFCDDNLAKDEFLRSNMDHSGWVHVTFIASFPRIKKLTTAIPTILESLKYSSTVEVEDNKLRRRDLWWKWPRIPVHLIEDRSRAASA